MTVDRPDNSLRVQLRWLIRRDMPQVLEIENLSFEYVWTEEHFIEYLRHRNCIGMVGEHNCRVVSFMLYELHRRKVRLLNFAVHPDFRRRGIGTQMIYRLADKLIQQRRDEIELEVRESNLAAQLFYGRNHFKATEVIREHYEDTDEDAYRMVYRLETGPCLPGLENWVSGRINLPGPINTDQTGGS